ncbi:MAG: ATP-binding protein [Pseudomonadota bacterium]
MRPLGASGAALGGVLRAVRQLGLRALAMSIAAVLLLNLALLGAAGYLDARDAMRAGENSEPFVLPILTQTAAAAKLFDGMAPDARAAALDAFTSPMLRFTLIEDFSATPPVENPKAVYVPLISAFQDRLEGRPFSVYVRGDASVWGWRDNAASLLDEVILVVRLADGSGLAVETGAAYRRLIARHAFAYVLGALGIVLVGVLTWASVSYAQPLARLAAASSRFSRDLDAEPMAEAGPKPVRELAAALNAMQERLRELVAERATAVAAVAHDMRTYLTRLRMRAEFIDDPDQQARAVRDLDDLNRLLEDALALGESSARPAERAPLALAPFLRDFVSRRLEAVPAPALTLSIPEGLEAEVETDAADLLRVLDNLVDNALRYAGSAEIALAGEDAQAAATLFVRDDGPGVPEDMLEAITKPYARLETSRSRETGGAGLGLAIAVSRAARAGAALALSNRAGGGLEARLSFAPERRAEG